MKYRILRKGDYYRVQFWHKGFFGERWKDLQECWGGDCQRATFYSLEQAQKAVATEKKRIAAEKIGWQIIKEEE